VPGDRVLALQRAAGNRAVSRLLQRTPMLHDWDNPVTERRTQTVGEQSVSTSVHTYARTIDAAGLSYYQLTDWLERAESHKGEVTPELRKQVRALRKTKKPAHDPMDAIDAFEKDTGPLAFDVSRTDVATHLRDVLVHPERINQGKYGLCGPDALLRAIVIRHPEAYVAYVLRLATRGVGRIGNLEVVAAPDVRGKHFKPGDLRHGIAAADWIALASLRSAKNKVYSAIRHMDGRSWYEGLQWLHAGAGAGSDVDELAAWAREMGLPPDKVDVRAKTAPLITNVLGPRQGDFAENWQRIDQHADAGWDVLLAIHKDVMGNAGELPRWVIGAHFVLLRSRIVAETKNGIQGFGFDAMTWGGVKHGWFAATDASMALIGYVAMDLRGALPAGPVATVTQAEAKYVFSEAYSGEEKRLDVMEL
jgi:hypothetical protein